MAAPVCVAMIAEGGNDRENTLSEMYGGKGDAKSGANPLYEAIGDVSTSPPRPAYTNALTTVTHAVPTIKARMASCAFGDVHMSKQRMFRCVLSSCLSSRGQRCYCAFGRS